MAIDRKELAARLRRHYDWQCKEYPKTAEIGWKPYFRRNFPTVLRNAREGIGTLERYANP